jgi:large subunit ribosomal protein L31
MKDKIHPKYYDNAKVTCLCGNTFTIGSTKPEIRIQDEMREYIQLSIPLC